ncbi:MAG: hemerythrin domain-containing protein [Steroidobacteraceae bacterium]
MSFVDKVVAAVTPPESAQSRLKARAKARAAAGSNDWLALILDHHVGIEDAFAAVGSAQGAAARTHALKSLALIMTGHSNAEEAVIYPALVRAGHKSDAMSSYAEQADAKANMGELEYLDVESADFLHKLEHIHGAVAHHMYEEESDRFLDLKELPIEAQNRLTRRYQQEFERYMGNEAPPPISDAVRGTRGASPAAR